MKPQPDDVPPPSRTSGRQGIPGVHARNRGFSSALSPLIAMAFTAGMVFGGVLRPSFLQGWHAGILLLLIAFGLYVTWKRAVMIYLRHEEGARGEEQVARVLDALPESWQVYHGLPMGEKEVDHVLVAPDQVFSIETVNWRGQVRVINHKLMHGENFYPGYELKTLSDRADVLAEELGMPKGSVTPMVCIVGGRYGDYPGMKEGVWMGEIQDLGTFLLGEREEKPHLKSRSEVLKKLEAKMSEGEI
ncbi:nuclease-related domain-containing protein [Kiritimatiellaeota bacterium B1221]|nr:nuclease-related domain-containing protein [Kiritimatiellaeota bacterium B1221]